MKTRNGFVSNSSSSSFVVAFPKKPKNSSDVWKFMFNGEESGLSVYDLEGLSYAQVSDIVFNDIKHGNFKVATKKDIVEIFSGRYHYYPKGNFWTGKCIDEDGGSWIERCGRYYGNNKELMNELKKILIEREKSDKELRDKEDLIIKKGVGNSPKYAYKEGTDPYTKKPYTKKEIKAQEDYDKKRDNFTKTDKEYLEFEKNKCAVWRSKWDKACKIQDKIAEEDAQNFLDDNKGKFVFIISYSDNDSDQGNTMEHGNIFRNVEHVTVTVSQH